LVGRAHLISGASVHIDAGKAIKETARRQL
jgi:hypothetical protein